MAADVFANLLEDLGKLLKIQDLHPDDNQSCLVNFSDQISIQFELDRSLHYFMIICKLGPLAKGRYRENVFREALKSNGLTPPRHGDFAYSEKADQLVMIEMLPLDTLNADKIADNLTGFKEKALQWKTALSRGDIPSYLPGSYASKSSGGMFGLR